MKKAYIAILLLISYFSMGHQQIKSNAFATIVINVDTTKKTMDKPKDSVIKMTIRLKY